MAAFPVDSELLKSGFKYQRQTNVVRSDMESGPAKQSLRASKDYVRFPVEYFFKKTEFIAFKAWVKDTIGVVGEFDWTEPLSNDIMVVKIVNGDISDATPVTTNLSHWIVKFTLEVIDTNFDYTV